ncbi:uncharacterized protein GGS22DRAFT_178918 [Annulohypoxylon maeteangense]|uniref:uncharacterized protein n=1 Tax=Annulohypoxylon maeteangense TaxID=1927788 RepID=UPI00200819E9|nr:uncharacterized protein GGS22DRAFT_178918 [Annulohypoxylon maeteangense]KAI0886935.1 hypothetical protein GGS22DRAFT_178918 [Annulohypoxylon maeteangense]
MSAQDLARSLVAAGSVNLPDNKGEGIYTLSVRDGYLVEKHWVGDVIQNENVIASNVKDNTTASYLLNIEQDLRLVVFIDQDNAIQCSAYNDDIEEWEETPLGDKWNIETNPQSKLSATIGPEDEIVISYQDVNGRLAGIMGAGEEWKAFGPLAGNPISGTPQRLEVIDDIVYLFYIEEGAGIGYLVLDLDAGVWKANVLHNTKFDTIVDNFCVTKDFDTGSFQSYFLTGGSLWNVDGEKGKICLGNVETNGRLIPSDKAQAGFRVKWRGARKLEAMAMDTQPDGMDIRDIKVTTDIQHSKQKNGDPPIPEHFGIDLTTPVRRWEKWVVKLTFDKLGKEQHGNGFYVNVPNPNFDVILTAGHNLVDKPEHYCSNIRIVHDPHTKNDIPVTHEMIRVCQTYFKEPNELNAIFDYGVILLKRGKKDRHRGFGFNLMLGLAPLRGGSTYSTGRGEKDILQDSVVYVSGYMPGDYPPQDPRRSDGKCIRAMSKQLHYTADTMQGMSGGPVWIGFRGVETVVAIHNYGSERKGQGNRGSRLNPSVWHTIFKWVNIGWFNKSLHYRGHDTYAMHLHLPWNPTSNEGRVRVGKPGRIETLFDIIPVSARPDDKELNAGYGFSLRPSNTSNGSANTNTIASDPMWVRWEPTRGRISLTDRFDARCEVKIPTLIVQPGKPFSIQAQHEDSWKQLRMAMEYVDEGDWEHIEDNAENSADTSEISFISLTGDKLFEFK